MSNSKRTFKLRSGRPKCPGAICTGHWRFGFTLIEMLVSVALVLLMMVLFAEVFQISANTVSQQKGLGENDQRARTLTTIIKGDLDRRTFANVTPWGADEDMNPMILPPPGEREGYFYISENEPFDDTDDVLQFTIQLGASEERLTGKAIRLNDLTDPNDPLSGQALRQPDGDDGVIYYIGGGAQTLNDPSLANDWQATTVYAIGDTVVPTTPNGYVYRATAAGTSGGAEPAWPTMVGGTIADGGITWEADARSNNTGASRWAEVSYFLRNGNLYRRVLLIRQPYIPRLMPNQDDPQPRNFDDMSYLFDLDSPPDGTQDEYPGNFWEDFDYSAHYAGFPQLHAQIDLENIGAGLFQLGKPINRFGHDDVLPTTTVDRFHPREFADATDHTTFIGRFTHEETSYTDPADPNLDFAYPGRITPAGSPMDRATVLTLGADGVVDQFRGGSRRGEDVLLSNVHGFDVKVWDELYDEDTDSDGILDAGEDANRSGALETVAAGTGLPLGAFADVGHAADDGAMGGGDFRQANDLHAGAGLRYGPRAMQVNNRVFDTWHPGFDFDDGLGGGPDATNDPPPYRPFAGPDPDMTPGNADDVGVKRLQAIQIRIRYLDVASGQMRQLTLVHSLLRELDNN